MRKIALVPFFIAMALLLSSCWSEKEVNEMAIVTATGLDLTQNGQIRLSVLLAVPRLFGTGSAQGGGEDKLETSAGWVVSEEGDTIMDITRNMQKKLPREIYYSHSRVLVIGNELALQGTARVLDFFERYRQSQLISYVAVSETTALDILNFKPKYEKLASEVMKSEMGQNLIPSIRLVDFLDTLMSEGIEPYAPMLEIVKSQDDGGQQFDNLAVRGIAVFKDDRMIGQLSDKETRGVLWVKNQINKGVITVDIPRSDRKGKVSAELERVNVSRHVDVRNGHVTISLHIKTVENIYENTSGLDLDNEANLSFIKSQIEQGIKDRIEEAGEKVRSVYNSDIYGFGQSVYRHDPKVWREDVGRRWEEIFPQLKLSITVRGRIIRSGLTNHNIRPEE